jgi:hypothetical protein
MKRNLVSLISLGVFVTLAFGSSQDFTDGMSEGWDEGMGDAWDVPAAGGIEPHIFELSQLSGRQIWMVNGPTAECRKMEKLGMIVDCEQGRDTLGMEDEIVIWCQEFDHSIAKKILDHLGHPDFDIRTHVTYPPGTDNGECGELFEVTIRYKDMG